MSYQQLLREQFDLSEQDNIYDDFGCAIQSNLIQGRMYLTEYYLCFASQILGLNKKIKIHYKEIKEISKKKTYNIFEVIEVTISDQQSFIFYNFKDRNIAYDRIISLYNNINPNQDNAEDQFSQMEQSQVILKQNISQIQSQQQIQNINESNLDKNEIKQLIQDINQEADMPDDQLIALLNKKFKAKENWMHVIDIVFPFSVSEFFKNFYQDNAIFGLDKFSQIQGRKQIQLSNWQVKYLEEGEQINNQNSKVLRRCLVKTLQQVVPVVGIPFVKETRHQKWIYLKKKEKDILQFEMESKQYDVPYGDYFIPLEQWVVLSQSERSQKCLLKYYIQAKFVKSTIFQRKIQTNVEKGLKDNIINWISAVREQGFFQIKQEKYQFTEEEKESIIEQHNDAFIDKDDSNNSLIDEYLFEQNQNNLNQIINNSVALSENFQKSKKDFNIEQLIQQNQFFRQLILGLIFLCIIIMMYLFKEINTLNLKIEYQQELIQQLLKISQ